MKRLAWATLAAGLAAVPLAAQHESPPDSAVERASAAAREWLALVDGGDYAASWASAHQAFRAALTEQDWVGRMGEVRTPLGAASNRERIEARYTTELPNAPPGEYVLIQFRTDFDQLTDAVETIVPMKADDGTWRVSGYFIRPPR